MGPTVPSVGDFVYGEPVPLSSGYSRAGTPNTACTFNMAEMVGVLVPTGANKAPAVASKSTTATGLEKSFVYTAPVALSKTMKCSF
eukprot:CAMPEP_0115858372 /NCGR_PEP_ID=MMETSP0287-20121206/16062_1 /TAXON_ID=412157 /ORGANISM="Chrysochromulina rotalis, Strain UIO044" /LENGTH=85 /DNA_ID=CAMNT_0003312631 /DNA_START=109 /DNA_END=366 /DNA_ORIENTATION=+